MTHTANSVTIIGAGMMGLATACGLAERGFSITLIDAKTPNLIWDEAQFDLRVSAITHGSTALFKTLGVWPAITSARTCPYQRMQVWDAESAGELSFDCTEIASDSLGCIVENRVIVKALYEKLQQYPTVTFRFNETLSTLPNEGDLIIGADGANSWVRKTAGIAVKETPYQQSALVAVVRTEKGHAGTAWQSFSKQGILACLPLADRQLVSIVWSTAPDYAAQLGEMPEPAFNAAMTTLMQSHLGHLSVQSPRVSFPLIKREVAHPLRDNVLLIGDAAHTIHPLAGQGANLGLRDVRALLQQVDWACQRGRLPFGVQNLQRYTRSRAVDVRALTVAMSGFKSLFEMTNPTLTRLRGEGMRRIDSLPMLKRMLIKQAQGLEHSIV